MQADRISCKTSYLGVRSSSSIFMIRCRVKSIFCSLRQRYKNKQVKKNSQHMVTDVYDSSIFLINLSLYHHKLLSVPGRFLLWVKRAYDFWTGYIKGMILYIAKLPLSRADTV